MLNLEVEFMEAIEGTIKTNQFSRTDVAKPAREIEPSLELQPSLAVAPEKMK